MAKPKTNVAAIVLSSIPVTGPLGIGNLMLCLDKSMGTSTRVGSGVILVLKWTAIILFFSLGTKDDKADKGKKENDIEKIDDAVKDIAAKEEAKLKGTKTGKDDELTPSEHWAFWSLLAIIILYIVGIVFAATSKKIK